MSAWSSSSLAASDTPRKLLSSKSKKNNKSDFSQKKMFSSRSSSKNFKMGKMKSSAISPSVDEFDKMVGKPSPKKKMFSRKSFG